MSQLKIIRDIVYFDKSKAASLLSQFSDGLPTQLVESSEKSHGSSFGGSLGVPLVKGEVQGEKGNRQEKSQTKVLHHDLLDRVEDQLFKHGFCIDLNDAFRDGEINGELLREAIAGSNYLRFEGSVIIQDFNRLSIIAENFSYLNEFINKCAAQGIEESPEVVALRNDLTKFERQLKSEKDRIKKAKIKALLKSKKNEIENLIKSLTTVTNPPDDWLLEGINKWVSLYNKDQLHFRFHFDKSEDGCEIFANLKRNCFVDSDIENIKFAYGRHPNIKLTVFGLITSVPAENIVDKESTVITDSQNTDKAAFQKAFHNMFDALDSLEQFSSYDIYPNIKIYPIAVYRKMANKIE